MQLQDVRNLILAPALSILPERMDSGHTMLLAIGLQESGFKHREQIGGPARGFWQFEKIGVEGVLQHHTTNELAIGVCKILGYQPDEAHRAIRDNDVLAACFARLLMWQIPEPLPHNPWDAWDQYLRAWRPGKPRRDDWLGNWSEADL